MVKIRKSLDNSVENDDCLMRALEPSSSKPSVLSHSVSRDIHVALLRDVLMMFSAQMYFSLWLAKAAKVLVYASKCFIRLKPLKQGLYRLVFLRCLCFV